jgi:methylenetetrahydrofolate reductase (NADPH)
MRISELYQQDGPVLSFEFFPPKTDAGFRSLFRTIEDLQGLEPAFVSVTMGAGGSTRSKTVDLVGQIQRDLGLTAMAHLPCVGFERDDVAELLDRLQNDGIENVLALKGDPPNDPEFVHAHDGFDHASDLVEFLRSRWNFSIGAACFPEVHPNATSAEDDLRHLLHKVQAGSDFLITQLYFDNADYFDFVERARAIGIDVPIVAGIMPITSAANIRRIAQLSNARIPDELEANLSRVADDDEATLELGIEWATMQCRELIDRGAPGIHFYTLNRSPATRRIYEKLFR